MRRRGSPPVLRRQGAGRRRRFATDEPSRFREYTSVFGPGQSCPVRVLMSRRIAEFGIYFAYWAGLASNFALQPAEQK
jgi:hypothetical protein